MSYDCSFLRVLPVLVISVLVAEPLNTIVFEECYGSTFANFLTASCDAGHVISIVTLKAIAKRRDTFCPQEETIITPRPSDSCCRYNDSDCGDIYLGDGLKHYFSCNGRQKCIGIPIAWMDTPCRSGEYLSKTNYMRMEYECISGSGVASLTNNTRITNDEIHIWNPGYPDGNSFSQGGAITCSAEASCLTGVVITAIFLKFTEVTGICRQQIVIEDGMNKTEISCKSNNNYHSSDLYTSVSHFIKITVLSSEASNQEWRFWLKFKGVQNDSQVNFECGSHSRGSAQNPSPGKCTNVSKPQIPSPNSGPPTNSIMDQVPNITTTCPGNLQESYLKPSCGSSEVIAVDDVFLGSKPFSSNCPANFDIGFYNMSIKEQCCTKNESDCITQYLGASRRNFFLSCNGRTLCDKWIPQTDIQPTNCSAGGPYLANSNYMIMNYHCINTGNILQVGEDNSSKRDPVYVTNDDFPSETNKSGINKTCSIQATCGTKIRVVLVYLSLVSKEFCQQKITFTEENGDQILIDCDANTDSEVKDLFVSNTSFLLLTFSNKLPVSGGKFWIEFSSLNKTLLKVSCGKEHSSRSTCLPTAEAAAHRQNEGQNDNVILIAILVSLGVVLFIAIVVCILCFCREKIFHICCGGQKSTIHPETAESIFDATIPDTKTAPIATTFKGDQRKSLIPRDTTRSPKEVEDEDSKVKAKPQLRKYASEMQLPYDSGHKPLQKRLSSTLHEKRDHQSTIFVNADHAVEEKATRMELKRIRKERKRRTRESRRRLLNEEEHINQIGYNADAQYASVMRPFRVARHVANAFHPSVTRHHYTDSGQEKYDVPSHSKYDPKLLPAGKNYLVSPDQKFQNSHVNRTGSIRSTSVHIPADSISRDAYVQPTSMTNSYTGSSAHPNSMTGSFRGPPIQSSLSSSLRVPPIQAKSDGPYPDEPVNMGDSFRSRQSPQNNTYRASPSYPSALSTEQRDSEGPILHNGECEGQLPPQGSMFESYKNPGLRKWRRAAALTRHVQAIRNILEIYSVDNPNEKEVNMT